MDNKAQTDHIQKAKAHEHRDEQLEQAVIKNQLQTGRMPSVKTRLGEALEDAFSHFYNETFVSKSAVGGARFASRAEGGDVDGSAEDKGEYRRESSSRSLLTSAAFTSGMLTAPDGASPEIGQAFGSAERSFGEDGSGGSAGVPRTAASASAEMTLNTEGERLSVYQYVEAKTGLPLGYQGAVDTIRQRDALYSIRELTKGYPEFERLDGLPVSLRDDSRFALEQISHGAFHHATIHKVMLENKNNLTQGLPEFGTVGRRVFPAQVVIEIDPSKAFVQGGLAA